LRFAENPDPASAAPAPAGILAKARQWTEQHHREDPAGAAVRARVAREIAPYLGEQTSASILQTASLAGQPVLSAIEPVLELFLGCRAARSLVNAFVDRAIVRI